MASYGRCTLDSSMLAEASRIKASAVFAIEIAFSSRSENVLEWSFSLRVVCCFISAVLILVQWHGPSRDLPA